MSPIVDLTFEEAPDTGHLARRARQARSLLEKAKKQDSMPLFERRAYDRLDELIKQFPESWRITSNIIRKEVSFSFASLMRYSKPFTAIGRARDHLKQVSQNRENVALCNISNSLSIARLSQINDASAGRIPVGAKVEAQWRGGDDLFRATVVAVNGEVTYDVNYDDGDREVGVRREFIKVSVNLSRRTRQVPMYLSNLSIVCRIKVPTAVNPKKRKNFPTLNAATAINTVCSSVLKGTGSVPALAALESFLSSQGLDPGLVSGWTTKIYETPAGRLDIHYYSPLKKKFKSKKQVSFRKSRRCAVH